MYRNRKDKVIKVIKTKNDSVSSNGCIKVILSAIFFTCIILSAIYFSGRIDLYGYEKDLEKKIPFTKHETVIYGRYDKNVISFKTNYDTELIYTFPENIPMEKIAQFTKENVGQVAEIKIENIQSAYLRVFNIKVQ